MIIRDTPKSTKNLIIVGNEIGRRLQKNGFVPKYVDEDFLYFVKDEKIKKFMNGGVDIGK